MSNVLKNPELLKETNREFDFFDFQSHAKNLFKTIESLNGPNVTTLIGSYGSGKSVLLNEVAILSKKSKSKKQPKWIFFECWQYPDKKDLWEALILDLVEQIDGKKLDTTANPYSDLEGWRDKLASYLNNWKTALASLLGIALVFWVALSIVDDKNLFTILVSLTTAAILILLGTIEQLIKPQSKSSVSRLADYKVELERTLLSYDGPIYIVLEDVDRAGELGRRFFETVSHFVKEDKFLKKSIKVIVPVAEVDGPEAKHLQDSIDKASDNILFFKPKFNCERFISEVFTDEFLDANTAQLLSSTINPLLGKTVSVRKLKHILRNALAKHNRLNSKQFQSILQICIAIEFSKYMIQEYGGSILFDNKGNFKHKPLFEWAENQGLLSTETDSEQIHIAPKDYFSVSDEMYADIRFKDSATNSSTAGKSIHNRDYLLSDAYFNDI